MGEWDGQEDFRRSLSEAQNFSQELPTGDGKEECFRRENRM